MENKQTGQETYTCGQLSDLCDVVMEDTSVCVYQTYRTQHPQLTDVGGDVHNIGTLKTN